MEKRRTRFTSQWDFCFKLISVSEKMSEKTRLCTPLSQANSWKYIACACTPVKFQQCQNIPWNYQLHTFSWCSKYQQTYMHKHLLKLKNKGTKPTSKNINVVSNFLNLAIFFKWDNICRCSARVIRCNSMFIPTHK